MSRGRPILLYLPGAEALAKKTHAILGTSWQLIPLEVRYFPDGELKICLPKKPENSVGGADTYVIQGVNFTYPHSRQDVTWELIQAMDALTRGRANNRVAVTPWFPYACQDKTRRRESLGVKTLAVSLQVVGTTHVIAIDLHNDAIENAFDAPICKFNGLYASSLLIKYLDGQFQILSKEKKDEFAASAVDEGGGTRIKHSCKHTSLMSVIPTKIKDQETGKVLEIIINENVEGRIVIIFDDVVRTGGSTIETVRALKKKGAKQVIITATHANFCGNAIEGLDQLHKEKILLKAVFTDSFALAPDFTKEHPWFAKVSLDKLLAETLTSIHFEKPVSHLYLDDGGL